MNFHSSTAEAEFPAIPGINSRSAALATANDLELFLELLRQFADIYVDEPQKILDDLARGNRDAAVGRLHSLRGLLGLLGARELMQSALELETAISLCPAELDLHLHLALFAAKFTALVEAITFHLFSSS